MYRLFLLTKNRIKVKLNAMVVNLKGHYGSKPSNCDAIYFG